MKAMGKKTKSKYCNILLMGCDVLAEIAGIENPTEKEKCMRSDAMTVASLNRENGRIKLVSINRDIWVPIPGYGMGKINSPVVYGGPDLAVQVVNDCFHLDIEKYVVISISNMVDFVDSIGGVDMELTDEEAAYINEWIPNMRIITKRNDEVPELPSGGMCHLNGMQTVAHARNRTIGFFIGRENRIIAVLKTVIQKLKQNYSYPQILAIALRSLKYVKTNISIPEGIRLIRFGMKADLKNIRNYHLPEEGTYEIKTEKRFCLEVDFEKATERVYAFLKGDEDHE